MSGYQPELADARTRELRVRNRRTGLILASIALVFFVGILVKHSWLN